MGYTKQIYFLLNSLAGGGAETVAVRLSEYLYCLCLRCGGINDGKKGKSYKK